MASISPVNIRTPETDRLDFQIIAVLIDVLEREPGGEVEVGDAPAGHGAWGVATNQQRCNEKHGFVHELAINESAVDSGATLDEQGGDIPSGQSLQQLMNIYETSVVGSHFQQMCTSFFKPRPSVGLCRSGVHDQGLSGVGLNYGRVGRGPKT